MDSAASWDEDEPEGEPSSAVPSDEETVPARLGDGDDELSQASHDRLVDRVRQRLFDKDALVTRIGRFTVLEQIGHGGMGTVYAAYDEQLDRKIAVKVLHDHYIEPDAAQRFAREAQAMARLSHPNVVTVHEVGDSDGEVFMAMEFIHGEDLSTWIRSRPDWRDVLETFIQAGQGLLAAHEAGLVHRDLKPHNIMRSESGVVKVLDFGLARWGEANADDADEKAPAPLLESGSSSALSSRLTQTGAVMGTPAYMAPEQFYGEIADARSDQFSFCVALYEALYGERPYETTSMEISTTMRSKSAVKLPPPAAGTTRVPRWLLRVALRGLQPEPKDRWPSMAELLRALGHGRRRSQWVRGLGAGAVVLAIVGAAVGVQQRSAHEHRQKIVACEVEGAAIDQVWNDRARERLEQGMLSTGVGFAQRSVDTLTPWLDEYRDTWRAGRTQACLHGTVDHDWDAQRLDRSVWCFEDRRLQLEATVGQITTVNRNSVRRAVRIASYLDPVETCLDPELLERLAAPPTELRDEIRAIRALLIESDRHRHAGRFAEGHEVAKRAVERAEPLQWPPILANARFLVGRTLHETGRATEAEEALTHAYFEAQSAGATEVAFRSARSLLSSLTRQQRYHEALLWSRHADLLALSLTDPSRLDEAEGHYLLAQVHSGLQDYELATEHGERALAIRADALGFDHPITAAAMAALGTTLLQAQRPNDALDLYERSRTVWSDTVGPDHPRLGPINAKRGHALLALGRLDEALVATNEALANEIRSMSASNPQVARARRTLGQIYLAQGRLDEAEHMLRRSMDIWRVNRSQAGHSAMMLLLDLSAVDRQRGDYEAALARCERARAMFESALHPSPVGLARTLECSAEVALAQGNVDEAIQMRRDALARRESAQSGRPLITPLLRLGDALRAGAQLDEARSVYSRTLSIGEQVSAEPDCTVVESLVGLAEVELARGQPASATPLAERAVRIVDDFTCGPRTAAGARFALARGLAGDTGEPNGRARSLAERAQHEYATTYDEPQRAAVEAWLARDR